MIPTVLLTLACGLIAAQFNHALGTTPVLGAVLCASLFLSRKDLWIVGLGGMILRDLILGLSLFTFVRLGAMALVILAVTALKLRPNFRSLLTGLLIASPIFHLALAAGDWATGTCGQWAKTPQGFAAAIGSTVPYFQRSFIGDFLFTALFLAAYSAVLSRTLVLRRQEQAG